MYELFAWVPYGTMSFLTSFILRHELFVWVSYGTRHFFYVIRSGSQHLLT